MAAGAFSDRNGGARGVPLFVGGILTIPDHGPSRDGRRVWYPHGGNPGGRAISLPIAAVLSRERGPMPILINVFRRAAGQQCVDWPTRNIRRVTNGAGNNIFEWRWFLVFPDPAMRITFTVRRIAGGLWESQSVTSGGPVY